VCVGTESLVGRTSKSLPDVHVFEFI